MNTARIKLNSGYNNNCGLTVAAEPILSELEKASEFDVMCNLFVAEFVRYYNLPLTSDRANVVAIIKSFKSPQDKQILMGPVLRELIKHVIHNDSEVQEACFLKFKESLVNYLRQAKSPSSISASNHNFLLKSNEAYFNQKKNEYLKQSVPLSNASFNNNKKAALDFINNNEAALRQDWKTTLAMNYANYLAEPNRFLCATEAAIVLNQFGISTIDCSHALEEKYSAKKTNIELPILNQGKHWVSLDNDAKAVNAYNSSFNRSELHSFTLDEAHVGKNEIINAVKNALRKVNNSSVKTAASNPAKPVLNVLVNAFNNRAAAESLPSADKIVYSYKDIRGNANSFWVSKDQQIALDEQLAKGLENNTISEADLPKLSS